MKTQSAFFTRTKVTYAVQLEMINTLISIAQSFSLCRYTNVTETNQMLVKLVARQ